HAPWVRVVVCALALAASAPFLRAVFLGSRAGPANVSAEDLRRLTRLSRGVVTLRLVFGVVLIGVVVGQFTNVQTFSGIVLIALASAAVTFSRFAEPLYG